MLDKPAPSPEKSIDERGAPITSAQVFVDKTTLGVLTRSDGSYVLAGVPAGTQVDSHAPHWLSPGVGQCRGCRRPARRAGLHTAPGSAAAAGHRGHGNANADGQSQIERRGDDHDARGDRAIGAAKHDRNAPLRSGLHSRRELRRRSEREHQHARHPRRRIRDVHGGRPSRLSDDAHVLHERRQSVSGRREH